MIQTLLSRSKSIKSAKKLEHDTPYFLINKKEIKSNLTQFKKFFPGADIFYAMKANSETEVLKIIHGLGAGFEVASVGELELVKAIQVPAKDIIYGTAVKSAEAIKEFFDYGVDTYAFDSLQELEKISANAPGSKVYVRMRAMDSGSVFRFSEKFGAELDDLAPLLIRAKELGLVPYGISFHVGSQAGNPLAWAQSLQLLGGVMNTLLKHDIKVEILDIGGGYPCNYASTEEEITLKEISKHIYKAYKELPYQPRLLLEPGRGIIASAAVLVAEVIAKVERSNGTWLFLDAGVYNALFETMAYQGSTRYHISSMRHSYNSGEKMYSLAGPTGDSPDVISREAHLPEDMDVGDKLIFHSVGAYSMSVVTSFNGFHKPEVHVV
jgi:ornithine decarboxylase